MKHPPSRTKARALVLASLGLLDAGCSHYVRIEPHELARPSASQHTAILLLRDSTRLEMTRPYLAGSAIRGAVGACEGRSCGEARSAGLVALPEVESVEVRRFSAISTGMAIGVAAVVGALVVSSLVIAGDAAPTPPSRSGGVSCPQVYSFDGRSWSLDSGTFSGAIFPAARRTDHDLLEHLAPSGGEYRLRMVNALDETDHTDALRLRVVDHAPGIEVVPALAGQLHTFAHPRAPVAATDLRGADSLADVRARDGRLWRSVVTDRRADRPDDTRDGLVLDFERPAEAREARLWFTGTTTRWAETILVANLAAAGPGLDAWYERLERDPAARAALGGAMVREGMLRVSVWTGTAWAPRGFLWESGPELLKDQALVLSLDGITGDRLRVRLESPVGFWVVDAVQVDYGAEAPLEERELAPRSARHANGQDLTATLADVDGREHDAERGDDVEVRFEVPPLADGRARSLVLASTGWYHLHIRPAPGGSTAFVERLIAEPGAASRRALELLQTTLLHELLQ